MTANIRVYPNKKKGGRMLYAGGSAGWNAHISYEELRELVRAGEVSFVGKNSHLEADVLLSAIKLIEPTDGKTDMLYRAIRGGGLTAYVLELEVKNGQLRL